MSRGFVLYGNNLPIDGVIMSRRIGRILAFQALYSWDVGGVDIEDLLSFSWIERDVFEDEPESRAPSKADDVQAEEGEGSEVIEPVNEIKYCLFDKQLELFEGLSADKKNEVFTFARFLVRGTLENKDEIDGLIKSHLSPKWSIERINKVALAVVRIGVYELLYQKDTHPSIVIDEAVEIVKDYGSDDSYKFTNAILDKISKDIAR